MTLAGAVAASWGSAAAGSAGSANDVTPGVLGFIVVAALGVALFLLLRSMNKHLRRVRSVHDAGLEPGRRIEANPGTAANGGERGAKTGRGTSVGTARTAGVKTGSDEPSAGVDGSSAS